jgi:hypothetical protein
MVWLSDASLVAAVANADAMGFMTARRWAKRFREEHRAYKEWIVQVDENCLTTALSSLSGTWRLLINETVRKVQKRERPAHADSRISPV